MIRLLGTIAGLSLTLSIVLACRKGGDGNSSRSYRMGFANSAPRLDFSLYLQSLDLWSQRADAAIISGAIPWDSLLAGEKPEVYIAGNYMGLVNFYRSKNFKLWVYIDPENGLNRSSDADDLVQKGKSIAQPDMQQIYRRFVFLMDSMLHPEHLGFALETNLIRGSAPDSVYQGVKTAANAAAGDIRNFDKKVTLSVSVQVEYAWGRLTNSAYIGIDQDLIDFPFVQELGLSSYPYFNFTDPSLLPANYYSALTQGKGLPVFISEGGWTSQNITGFTGAPIHSSPQIQQAYIDRQRILLDQAQAIAVFQLTFTDIDLSALPPSVPSTIKYFAWLGLVDDSLRARPALNSWDANFKRPLKPGN
jgi:hypothetical protein